MICDIWALGVRICIWPLGVRFAFGFLALGITERPLGVRNYIQYSLRLMTALCVGKLLSPFRHCFFVMSRECVIFAMMFEQEIEKYECIRDTLPLVFF